MVSTKFIILVFYPLFSIPKMSYLQNLLLTLFFVIQLLNFACAQEDSPCILALRRYPRPDATYTSKHLLHCPELCHNSTGRYPTGQFPHPWDCNAFINCFKNDAHVHWCQTGLHFNQNNGQCDYPGNVNCSSQFTDAPGATTRKSEYLPTTPSSIVTLRVDPNTPVQHPPFTVAPGATTQKSEYLPTTPSSTKIPDVDPNTTVVTCRDSTIKLNEKECVGPRPDLCKQGSGRYAAPDCRYYIECIGFNAAVARCPGGFTFDPVYKQCDWPNKNPACLQSCTESGYFDKPKSLSMMNR